jgi:L-rhamnose-H+ transport protein
MTDSFVFGLIMVTLGGAFEGLFSIPVTKTPRWSFEQIWGAGSLVALVLVPWPLVLATVPDVADIYGKTPMGVLVAVFLSGVGWGLGGIFWGRAISALGMALGVSLLMGVINIFGSVAPLAIFEPAKLATKGGLTLMAAVVVMIGGVVVIAAAGKRREQEQAGGQQATNRANTPFLVGLGFCLLSGILSALVNFGFIFGRPLAEATAATGAPDFATSFPVWALVFTGNYLVNFIYALTMMVKRGSLQSLVANGSPAYWAAALFMGLAWPGGIIIYGIGASSMGAYGAYAGFPMMILSSILAGNLAGAVGGEWNGTKRASRLTMAAGVLIMFLAFGLLGFANRLLAGG